MKRIVIKVGSTFFIDKKGNINTSQIKELVLEIKKLWEQSFEVCLVTSGAIAVGVKKMKLSRKPAALSQKQALAAIGQMSLMHVYEQIFDEFGIKCAQVLLSHDDFGNRERLNNLRATLGELFRYGVTPIINENDAVATGSIKVGDNDTLSALASLVIDASLLVLVSDIDGLFTANPKLDKSAQLIPFVDKIDDKIFALAKAPDSEFGTGGMLTKIRAAKVTTTAGIPMAIIKHDKIDRIFDVITKQNVGTYFKENAQPEPKKKCWLKFCADTSGQIIVDDGAKTALKKRGSLLSCGIIRARGEFVEGSVVEILDASGNIFARGVIGFSAETVKNIVSDKKSLAQLIIHANNIAILDEN